MRLHHQTGLSVVYLVGLLATGLACDSAATEPEDLPPLDPFMFGTYEQVAQEGYPIPVVNYPAEFIVPVHGRPSAFACKLLTDSSRITITFTWIDIKWNGLLLCSDSAGVSNVRTANLNRRFAITTIEEGGFDVSSGDTIPYVPYGPICFNFFGCGNVPGLGAASSSRSTGDEDRRSQLIAAWRVSARVVGDSLLLGGPPLLGLEYAVAWGLKYDEALDLAVGNHVSPESLAPQLGITEVWRASTYRRVSP